jgi:hypothetical protein
MLAVVSIMLVVCLMTIYRHRRARESQLIRVLERCPWPVSRTRFLPDGGDSSGDVASSRWNDHWLKLAFRPGPVDVPG